jgi:SAM-dependent methyltransferase
LYAERDYAVSNEKTAVKSLWSSRLFFIIKILKMNNLKQMFCGLHDILDSNIILNNVNTSVMDSKSTTRFSNRVEDYVKYRPGYPKEIVKYLETGFGLKQGSTIADIGSGTGISSELFLNHGYKVIGVEPNKEMRDKSEELLGKNPAFSAVNGNSDDTNLDAQSVDAIIAGQAFHWFDRKKASVEFRRILKPKGFIALIWNERLTTSDFEKEYDVLIVKHSTDYVQVDHRNIDIDKISEFFNGAPIEQEIFGNQQIFDFNGLEGRLLSSSYVPSKGDAGYQAMSDDLKVLFDQYQENGVIRINYATKVFVGRVSEF